MAKRMRKNYTFISGVVLLIALAMLFVNVPLIDEKSIDLKQQILLAQLPHFL